MSALLTSPIFWAGFFSGFIGCAIGAGFAMYTILQTLNTKVGPK